MNVEVFLGGGARSWKLCQAGATLSRDDGGRQINTRELSRQCELHSADAGYLIKLEECLMTLSSDVHPNILRLRLQF